VNGENFKPGDRVRLARIEHGPYGAKIGATGTVGPRGYFDCYGERFLDIAWDRDDLSGNQMNGGYHPQEFDALGPDPRKQAQQLREQANAVERVAIAMRRLAFLTDSAVDAAEALEQQMNKVQQEIERMDKVLNVD
jgi:hypothetical protein